MNISGTEAFPSDISRTAPLGGAFAGKVAAAKNSDSSPKYPLLEHACGGKFPDVVKLARRVLAESEDGDIVYISVGSLPNAARLLESPPDEISPLTGACRAVAAQSNFPCADFSGAERQAARKNPLPKTVDTVFRARH